MPLAMFANPCMLLQIMSHDPTIGTRRTRFIATISLSLGLGVTMVPKWATNNLWVISATPSTFVQTIHGTVMNILSTGFMLGAITAIFLNFVLPQEAEVVWEPELEHSQGKLDDNEFKEDDDVEKPRTKSVTNAHMSTSTVMVPPVDGNMRSMTRTASVTMTSQQPFVITYTQPQS